ncbi:type 1 fimbrial protein [Leclercia adecarboxylata]|uniref:fimbrial protein n=1 Tax=Leclercia adecarboxylata TaxID=83655 RepID=UPI002DB5A935|nr:fimbrial protein [Leclercia adecarboxylata]MEB6379562.1 type 1 fimbrial protein [Leclercia adecarboxylata]
MKKNIIAVMVAAAAVLSAQAFAAGNTAQIVIHGTVTDTDESCNITPYGSITGGTVVLDDIKVSALEALDVNTPSLASAKDITYKVTDCKKDGKDFAGNLSVNVSGEYISGTPDILSNQAANPAKNAGLALINSDSTRVQFDGSKPKTVAYASDTPTLLTYKAAYVKTAAGVEAGEVKGVATFTITY